MYAFVYVSIWYMSCTGYMAYARTKLGSCKRAASALTLSSLSSGSNKMYFHFGYLIKINLFFWAWWVHHFKDLGKRGRGISVSVRSVLSTNRVQHNLGSVTQRKPFPKNQKPKSLPPSNYFTLCVWVFCIYIRTMCLTGVQEGQKRASNSLELELLIVVSSPVGYRNETQVPLEKQQVFLTTELSSVPNEMYF